MSDDKSVPKPKTVTITFDEIRMLNHATWAMNQVLNELEAVSLRLQARLDLDLGGVQ